MVLPGLLVNTVHFPRCVCVSRCRYTQWWCCEGVVCWRCYFTVFYSHSLLFWPLFHTTMSVSHVTFPCPWFCFWCGLSWCLFQGRRGCLCTGDKIQIWRNRGESLWGTTQLLSSQLVTCCQPVWCCLSVSLYRLTCFLPDWPYSPFQTTWTWGGTPSWETWTFVVSAALTVHNMASVGFNIHSR